MFDPKEAAENEIGWYEDHHLRDYNGVTKKMARVHEMLFGLSPEIALKVVLPKIESAKEHDLAEEAGISEEESRQHWDKAKEFMEQHFKLLDEAITEIDNQNKPLPLTGKDPVIG